MDILKTSVLLLLLPLAARAQTPDAIYYNGRFLTGIGLATAAPQRATSIAISHGKVLATGTDSAMIAIKGPLTKMVDLHGAFALPGFNDAHVHLAGAGQQKLAVDLTGSNSLTEMQARIAAAAAKAAPGAWLQGGGWDHTLWATKQLPTAADLDQVTPGHPALFERIDGHIAVANTEALVAAGITASTPDPQGGKFDHDSAGTLTGIVRETPAVRMIAAKIPPPTMSLRKQALLVAINDALAHGLTSVQDYSDWDDFLAMEELERSGQLHLRISEWLDFTKPVAELKREQASHPADDPLLHTGMLKGFMDGSLGSRTAALNAPYTDDPGNSGLPRFDQTTLDQMATERAEAGFQLGFHAIGDRAVAMALTAFDVSGQARMKSFSSLLPQLQKSVGAHISVTLDARNRIEHAQLVDPADIDRMARLGVVASIQPNYILTDMNWAAQRLGPARTQTSYPLKTFLDHHIPLALSTDYPVEPITPFRGIYAAVTRMNEAGTISFEPQEKITLGQALYAYTQGSAYAEKRERIKGTLAPGQLADFTVLDRDLTSIAPAKILKTRVLRTVVGGETVYSSDGK